MIINSKNHCSRHSRAVTAEKEQNSVMHTQSCCNAYLKLLLLAVFVAVIVVVAY